ncbi:hypothetical protein IJT93_03945 [bacterium]|nr:hypothetical protein [bacterium]
MTVMLSQRIEEIVKTLPKCSISDVKVTSDENKIVFDFKEVLDKYYFVQNETDLPSDLDFFERRKIESEEERCWDDFVLEFMSEFRRWLYKKVTYLPKDLLDEFSLINSSRPFSKIIGSYGSEDTLFNVWNYNENIYEVCYPSCRQEIKETALRFSIPKILSLTPEEKRPLEVFLRESDDGAVFVTPEGRKLRADFVKKAKKASRKLFKELANILVSSLPSFLDEVPGLLARQLVNYDMTDISKTLQSK